MTTLIFSTSSSWISSAIRWFTRSKASHVMIGTEVHGVPMLLHCTSGGVQFTPRARWLKTNRVVSEWTFLSEPDVDHAMSHLGDKYDYLTLFGWGAAILLWRWFKIKVRNPWQSPTAMVCSEFVCHVAITDHTGISSSVIAKTSLVSDWIGLNPETTHCQTLLDLMPGRSFERVT